MQDKLLCNKGYLNGTVRAYPSKSYLQRALALGLLNINGLKISNFKECGDTKSVLDSIVKLGAQVEIVGDCLKINGVDEFIRHEIHCRESGLCLRMFAPILSLSATEFRIFGEQSLLKRGNEHISEVLLQAGVKCRLNGDFLSVQGPLKSGEIFFENPAGSQLITGLLFALSKVKGDSKIMIKNPVSFPYIKMTAELLNNFGAKINIISENEILVKGDCEFSRGEIDIEGDWSGAAFFLIGGAISGDVTVTGLNNNSLQSDKEIINYLRSAGAEVVLTGDSVRVTKKELHGFDADITDHPDLFIPLVILALNCEGVSRIYNYERLKNKESDRPAVIITELKKAGAYINIRNDHMEIKKSILSYAELNTYNDHRLAMGFAAVALNSKEGLSVNGTDCVKKSYPVFFEELTVLQKEN